MKNNYWVYMLRCNDGSYYTGVTNDVTARIHQHQAGKDTGSYTFSRRPVERVYSAWFTDVFEAISWEKQIKRWSRKKKEALIRGEYEMLPGLAKCLNGSYFGYFPIILVYTKEIHSRTQNIFIVSP